MTIENSSQKNTTINRELDLIFFGSCLWVLGLTRNLHMSRCQSNCVLYVCGACDPTFFKLVLSSVFGDYLLPQIVQKYVNEDNHHAFKDRVISWKNRIKSCGLLEPNWGRQKVRLSFGVMIQTFLRRRGSLNERNLLF